MAASSRDPGCAQYPPVPAAGGQDTYWVRNWQCAEDYRKERAKHPGMETTLGEVMTFPL